MGMYLTGVHLMGVDLTGVDLNGRVSHRRASHVRVPHGRVVASSLPHPSRFLRLPLTDLDWLKLHYDMALRKNIPHRRTAW
jgi:hypothetical protein